LYIYSSFAELFAPLFAVLLGKRNSIKGRDLVKNPDVYFVGCPCNMAHNATRKGSDSFSGSSVSSGFNVEDLVVDLDYHIFTTEMFVLLVEMHLKDENDKPQSDNDFGKFEFKMASTTKLLEKGKQYLYE
jgi:hypothetical protein